MDGIVVRGLRAHYSSPEGVVPAVDGVDLTIAPGERVGVVGESGSGKSTLGRALIRLVDGKSLHIIGGSICLDGVDLLEMDRRGIDQVRGAQIGIVFQNPQTSLNPVLTIGDQVGEPLRAHTELTKTEIHERVVELLGHVGIGDPELRRRQYPHELSGGMQQRVAIAMALACSPRFLIADEPTTALDVTIQAQVLQLLARLSEESALGVLLISHNLGVVAQICTKTLVMYGGVVVESGPTAELFERPRHPYTRGLIRSIPNLDEVTDRLYAIPGTVGRIDTPVTACRFASRCAHAIDHCREAEPPIVERDGHGVRCWRTDELEVEELCVAV